MSSRTLPLAGAVVATLLTGYLLGAAFTAPVADPGSTGQIHVSVEIVDGEVESVSLTDEDGLDVPVGSVAESWDDDNTDTED